MKTLIIDVTSKCNLKCIHCYNNSQISEKDYLSFDKIELIFKKAKSEGSEEVLILGGEPFSREDIYDIFELANRNDLLVSVTTNATLIDDKAFGKLSKIDFKTINFSLDGSKDSVNDLVRGSGTFKKIIAGIKLLKKLQTDKVSLRCAYTLNNHNIGKENEAKDLLMLLKELEIGFLSIQQLWSYGRARNLEIPTAFQFLNFVEEVISESKKYPCLKIKIDTKMAVINFLNIKYSKNFPYPPKTCSAIKESLYVNVKGIVFPCSTSYQQGFEYPKKFKYPSIEDFSCERINSESYFKDFLGYVAEYHKERINSFCPECLFKTECVYSFCPLSQFEKKNISNCEEAIKRKGKYFEAVEKALVFVPHNLKIRQNSDKGVTIDNGKIKILLESHGFILFQLLKPGKKISEIILEFKKIYPYLKNENILEFLLNLKNKDLIKIEEV